MILLTRHLIYDSTPDTRVYQRHIRTTCLLIPCDELSSETDTICGVLVREKTIYDVGVGSPKNVVASFNTFYQCKGQVHFFI